MNINITQINDVLFYGSAGHRERRTAIVCKFRVGSTGRLKCRFGGVVLNCVKKFLERDAAADWPGVVGITNMEFVPECAVLGTLVDGKRERIARSISRAWCSSFGAAPKVRICSHGR